MGTGTSPGGLLAALRGLLATLAETAEVRLDVWSTELEIEKRRLFDALLLSALALVLLTLGLVALCALAILLFWDSYRLGLLLGLGLVFLGLGSAGLLYARHCVRNSGGPFATSIAELRQDSASLRGEDGHA